MSNKSTIKMASANNAHQISYCWSNLLDRVLAVDGRVVTPYLQSLSGEEINEEWTKYTSFRQAIKDLKLKYDHKYISLGDFLEEFCCQVVPQVQSLKCGPAYLPIMDEYLTGVAVLANKLNPNYFGMNIEKLLNAAELQERSNLYFAKNMEEKEVEYFSAYTLKTSVFLDLFQGSLSPERFWGRIKQVNPILYSFVNGLLKIPAFLPKLNTESILENIEELQDIEGDENAKLKYFRYLKLKAQTEKFFCKDTVQ